MRTKRQQAYDKFIYCFPFDVYNFFADLRNLRRTMKYRAGKEFRENYRKVVVPYWRQFGVRPPRLWCKHMYHLTGSLDPRYIPNPIHYRNIITYFDDPSYEHVMEDKNLYSVLFPSVKRPETICKHFATTIYGNAPDHYTDDDFTPLSREEAVRRCLAGGKFIIKPTCDTGGGSDVKSFSSEDGAEAIEALFDSYRGVDFIIQRFVKQHADLARLNDSSLNTMRIVTMVFHEKPYLLSAILRVGHQGSPVDNYSSGGYQCTILPDGTLDRLAATKVSGVDEYVEENENGLRFEGIRVPSWDAAQKLVMELAVKLPHLKYIGWDIAVDEDGDLVLIEFNCHIDQNQETCGPTFGDMTDEVLADVFRDRIEKRKGKKARG